MVKHKNSPLWKLWRQHLFAGIDGRWLSKQEWYDWMVAKGEEWRNMKRDKLVDVKGLSIAKRIPYKVLTGKFKPGRKRGRRKKRVKSI